MTIGVVTAITRYPGDPQLLSNFAADLRIHGVRPHCLCRVPAEAVWEGESVDKRILDELGARLLGTPVDEAERRSWTAFQRWVCTAAQRMRSQFGHPSPSVLVQVRAARTCEGLHTKAPEQQGRSSERLCVWLQLVSWCC